MSEHTAVVLGQGGSARGLYIITVLNNDTWRAETLPINHSVTKRSEVCPGEF